MKETLTLRAETPTELPLAARQLWDSCGSRKIFAFYGNLGAGKTAFIRAICQMLEVKDDVSSPTFAIVNEYFGERPIYHIDLYRLERLSQAIEIGIEEYMSRENICFIEWPELVETTLPTDVVRIHIDSNVDGSRNINVSY